MNPQEIQKARARRLLRSLEESVERARGDPAAPPHALNYLEETRDTLYRDFCEAWPDEVECSGS